MKRIIIFLLLITYSSYSQSLSVFDIDTSSFPTIKAKFYAFDNSGNQILNLNTSDFEVTEDGVKRNVTYVSCPAPKPPVPISSVLTIDVSGSMTGVGIGYAKEAAKAWVQALPLGQSECAITSFNSNNFFNQDFTTNRNRLLNRIEELATNDGTDFNAALINPMSGGLLAVEKGKYKKVVILLTDGYSDGNETAIIQKANQINATVFCVTVGTPCPLILRNISEQTGGLWFENITTAEQAREVFLRILKITQGGEACEIEWKSGISCSSGLRIVEIKLTSLSLSVKGNYLTPSNATARLEFKPTSVFFMDKELGKKHDTTITVTAFGADFNVSNITGSSSSFQISPKNFILKNGEYKILTLSYTTTDSGYSFSELDFINNICQKKYYVSGGFRGVKPKKQTLKLKHPNGGEIFLVGCDTVITWEGISDRDTVRLEYSIDNGNSWKLISNLGTNLKYMWKNLQQPTIKQCLVRVSQYINGSPNDKIPKIEWQNNYVNASYAESIKQTSDGGFIVAGCSVADIGTVPGHHGKQDFFVIKLDNMGKIEWQKYLGGSKDDWAYSVIETRNGDYVVVGESESNDGNVSGNHSNNSGDWWIVRLNNFGQIKWQKCLGGSNYDRAISLVEDKNNNLIIGGATASNDGDVTGHHDPGGRDFMVIKLNSIGQIIWQKCYGGDNYDYLQYISAVKDGCFIMTGWANSNNGDITNNKGSDDIWIAKINENGNIEWQRTFGGSKSDQAFEAHSTIDNGFIVSGCSWSDDGDITTNKGRSDIWLLKLDSLGILKWQKTYGGSDYDDSRAIAQSYDGSYISVGLILSNDGDFNKKPDHEGFSIVKLDQLGNLDWHLILGGSSFDHANSVQQTFDGGYVIAGHYKGFTVIKLSPENNIFQQDVSDSVFSIVAPQASSHDIDMGQVLINTKKDSVINDFISNIGSWKFRVDSIYFRGADASAFSMLAGFPKYELEAGKSNFAEFRFAPTEVRNYQAEIVIITQSDTLIQNIIGEGVKEEVSVFGEIIDFGIREIADYKDTTMVLITNNSNNPVDFNSIIMLGPDKEQFEFVNGNVTPLTLNSGESHTMTLRFNPKYIGRTSGQIGFFHNAAGSPSTVQLFGAGVGAHISASSDSAYAGEVVDVNIKLESGNLTKFSELIGSFDGIFRIENSILTPVYKSDLSKTQNDSAYIKFSGNVNPKSSTLASIKLKAGLGRVEETSIDFENINWYDMDGNLLDYDTDFSSGHFKLLGICREGGTRLVNPNAQAGMMTIAPNPAENKLDISLSLTEKGYTEICIYNVLGEVVKTIFSESVSQYNIREISTDLSELSTGQYLIILKTPTYVESSRLMIMK